MRRIEDIKKGLDCHALGRNRLLDCSDCAYHGPGLPHCSKAVHEDAVAMLEQLAAQVPKWISVEERLPKGKCLAGCFAHGSYGYGEYIIGYVAPYSESEGSGYCAEDSFVLLDDVTHWMTLPEPPKEDAE